MKQTISFKEGIYLTSQISHENFPVVRSTHGTALDEVAIAGRSNVGKSSLLNHLLLSKKLAKISSRPGKTQTLNFFRIDNQLCLVDLPGYGFAKASKTSQEKWSLGIDDYLNQRKQLKLLLLLIDFRHPPMDNDLQLLNWAHQNNQRFLIIFTKSDKIPKNKRSLHLKKNIELLQEKTGINPQSYVLYSIKDNSSRDKLIQTINKMLWDC